MWRGFRKWDVSVGDLVSLNRTSCRSGVCSPVDPLTVYNVLHSVYLVSRCVEKSCEKKVLCWKKMGRKLTVMTALVFDSLIPGSVLWFSSASYSS